MSVSRRLFVFLFLFLSLLSSGCVLQARAFLPLTGRYVSVLGDPADGGWRAESLVVTSNDGSMEASVQVWISLDAGTALAAQLPTRPSVMLIDPLTGSISTDSGGVLLPNPVVVGSRWRVTTDSSCFVQEEVVSATPQRVVVAHSFGCDGQVEPPFMESIWGVNAGWVEYGLADGGLRVRVSRAK